MSVSRPRSPSIGSIISVGLRKAGKCEGDCETMMRKLRDKIERLEGELEVTQALLRKKESEISFLNEKFTTVQKLATMTPEPSPTMTKVFPYSVDDALMGNYFLLCFSGQ